jgi:acetyl-CoA carboxylase carboxyl transferase subunit beta
LSWFKRLKDGITTSTREKKEAPDGLWVKCPSCKKAYRGKEFAENSKVCPGCGWHDRLGSEEYFNLLYDDQQFDVHFQDLKSIDFLPFTDLKNYGDRLEDAYAKTQLNDAMNVASGLVGGNGLVTAAMDFKFIGGSMGSVVGEKISKAIDLAIEHKYPLLIISKSGGARMMESAFSLMQMAKTSAKLTQLADAQLPYYSLMTDPTTGGVTASFAMLGDINMAEPGALIGFAGPRVIKETIKKDLPKGFQRSEFILDSGFLDFIVDRRVLKQRIIELMSFMAPSKQKA